MRWFEVLFLIYFFPGLWLGEKLSDRLGGDFMRIPALAVIIPGILWICLGFFLWFSVGMLASLVLASY
jgi:hypothetical protein